MWWKLHSQSAQINIPKTRTSWQTAEGDDQPNLTIIQDRQAHLSDIGREGARRRGPSGGPTGENTILASGRDIFMIATKTLSPSLGAAVSLEPVDGTTGP